MISVALIGPDGCGKTTIARRLESALPLPARYLYMGVNLEASDVMLPTTRLLRALRRRRGTSIDGAGPRDPDATVAAPGGATRRIARELRSLTALALRVSEEWYRQLRAWAWQRRGYVVIFDRHYHPDYYAYDIQSAGRPLPLHRRLHGWLLEHVYPKPDLVLYLDAPAAVLHARKGEGTLALLDRRRHDYLALQDVLPHFAVVAADRPERDVADEVADLIVKRLEALRAGVPR